MGTPAEPVKQEPDHRHHVISSVQPEVWCRRVLIRK